MVSGGRELAWAMRLATTGGGAPAGSVSRSRRLVGAQGEAAILDGEHRAGAEKGAWGGG